MKKIIGWMLLFTIIFVIVISYQDKKISKEIDSIITEQDTIIPIDSVVVDTTIMDTPIILEDSTTITVYATMYHPVLGQCDASPDITADQSKIPDIDSCSHLCWIAVSQDLLWFNNGPIRYGDTVYVEAGHKTGYYIVRDAMNRRFKKKIDFLESVGTEAYRYKKATLHINS